MRAVITTMECVNSCITRRVHPGYYHRAFKQRFFRIGVDGQTGEHCLAYYTAYDDVQPIGLIPLYLSHVVDPAQVRN